MSEHTNKTVEAKGLRSREWRWSYRTSSTLIDGRPVNMLHDFYIPALQLANRYDRVAGYFRSSSLAAASQGFSSFISRDGKMRLIVGADLEPEDVAAILNGDAARFAERLQREIEHPESWPEQVRNGVTLLAWMIAHGYLEVRVAFRTHMVTGEILSFDDVSDGYVHEKWFIMQDEFGNRMYGTGTLNESKTAFVLNAENLDLHCDWKGETDKFRVDDAVQAFENFWHGRVKHMPVLSLPEAVKQSLIRFAEHIEYPVEVDGTSPRMINDAEPSAMERLKFSILRDGPRMPGGRYVGMETAPVDPWPHQKVVVRRLVETWPYSYLLCDEVGLGKTIEAGLAFRSLHLSGLAKRILIAAPASLTSQWHRQMAEKMLMPFGKVDTVPHLAHEYILPNAQRVSAQSMYEPNLTIVSTGLLSRSERLADLRMAADFDIVLVDEAHAARRSNSTKGTGAYPDFGKMYLTLRDELRNKAKSLWLATATPMQLHPVEVYDLLALTNRVGIFQFDPTITDEFYRIIDKLVRGLTTSEAEWEFMRRAVAMIRHQDPMLWRYFESYVIDSRFRAVFQRWLEYGYQPRGKDRELLLRLLFSAAPLSRVMMRHTRKLLEIYKKHGRLRQNLAQRHVLRLEPIQFNPLEREIYDQLERYCSGLNEQIQRHGHQQQMMNFLLSFLRLRFASSLYAFRETMKRRLQKVEATFEQQRQRTVSSTRPAEEEDLLDRLITDYEEDSDASAIEAVLHGRSTADLEWERSRINEMLRAMGRLPNTSSKMKYLLTKLDQRRIGNTNRFRQTVIFTRFYDTLTDIVHHIRMSRPDMRVGTYSGQGATWFNPDSGQMEHVERENVKERFLRGEIDVLVCTDAAAEGLNLQTADMLINFDMGWNPMKIEQRIGRIDRIGQKFEHIFVVNLCYADSEEAIVYGRLLDRLTEANLIVGTQQISLLPVEPDEFLELAQGRLTVDELERRSIERLEEQRRRSARMEMSPEELYEIYGRMTADSNQPFIPVDLQSIWNTLKNSRLLQSRGCTLHEIEGEEWMEVYRIDGIPDGTIFTISRKLYDEGLPGDSRRVRFASYGDPYFDRLLALFVQQYELPPCVKKISVSLEGLEHVPIVGYVVVCRGNQGEREVRLIRSWLEADNVELLEDESVKSEEAEMFKVRLHQMALEEFESCLAAGRIERVNRQAADVQQILNYRIASDLLQVKGGSGASQASFWPVLREVEQLAEERERVMVSDMPSELLRAYQQHLPYECAIPSLGDRVSVNIPNFAIRSAAEAARREAEAMKVKRSELMLHRVLARLHREAAALRENLVK
jgi:hypothetical protein